MPLLLCQRSLTILVWVYFWALSSILLTYLSVLLLTVHCLDYCSFTVSIEVGYYWFFLLLQYYWLFYLSISNSEFINIYKITYQDCAWDCIEFTDQVGKNWHIDNIEFSYPWVIVPLNLDFLWLIPLGFYIFPHRDLVHILLGLYLCIFIFVAVKMALCFLF